MKITTWNINSVRLRLPILKKLADLEQPDIICLQETKVDNPFFPIKEIEEIGYKYQAFDGEKSYNGVAILSKIPFESSFCLDLNNNSAKRHVAITTGDLTIHNFYVPAGGDIPDTELNPKFKDKLSYLDNMNLYFTKKPHKDNKVIIVGDLNIAPLEHDVWSHKQLLKEVSHTPIEIEKMGLLYEQNLFCDAIRKFYDDSDKVYSWWSYRNKDWKKSNRGRRLDHIWTSKALIGNVKNHKILKDARDWTSPSDHVPVIIDLDE